MLIRVIDFETTGMPPDAAVCEVGWCDVRTYPNDPCEVGDPCGVLVNPNRPMPPEARAVHHISDGDLRDAPPVAEGFALLMNGGVGVFAAHNCEFERAFFGGGLIAWICTLKVARRLWPECPSHSNQCLRYWLELQVDGQLATPPHRAAPDAYVTALILQRALEQATVEQMIEWTTQPSLLPRVEFGKHRGQPWKDLPTDYLDWIVRKSELDADVKFTASHHLRRSRA